MKKTFKRFQKKTKMNKKNTLIFIGGLIVLNLALNYDSVISYINENTTLLDSVNPVSCSVDADKLDQEVSEMMIDGITTELGNMTISYDTLHDDARRKQYYSDIWHSINFTSDISNIKKLSNKTYTTQIGPSTSLTMGKCVATMSFNILEIPDQLRVVPGKNPDSQMHLYFPIPLMFLVKIKGQPDLYEIPTEANYQISYLATVTSDGETGVMDVDFEMVDAN